MEISPEVTDGVDPASPLENGPSEPDGAAQMESLQEEDEGEIADDIKVKPESAKPQRRKKRKGIRLSFILNLAALGLGTWGAIKGWKEHIEARSVQFLTGLGIGAWMGLGLMRRYNRTKRVKDRRRRILGFNYGPRELRFLTRGAPYWVDFSRIEQLSSVNSIIRQMWRFYEKAICKQIAETVEPLMMQYKPVFVSAIKFKKLTFGDAPFKATHMRVIKEETEEIVLEMGIRWDGAAHVAISVEVMGTGMVTPAVKRLNFFANVRLGLTRMKPVMPGFGAMMISFQKPPLVTFDLDCGPGLGEVIEAWLIPFLKNDLLGNMLVWPNRIVVPLLPAEELGPLDSLRLRTKGVLKVNAIEARGLPKADFTGKGDPFAIFETVAFKPVKTKVIYNTDKPQWKETMFLKVQEVDQSLRVTVRDQESTIVGAISMNTSELQGRAIIPLENLVPGRMVDDWYPLGMGDWGDNEGPGTGSGEIHLQLTYFSLDDLRKGKYSEITCDDTTPRGLVFLTVQEASHLGSVDGGSLSDPYAVVWLDGIKKTTKVLKNTRYPVWNESMDWANVSALKMMFVEIYDKGRLSDQLLGKAKMPILPIVKAFSHGTSQPPLTCTLDLEGNKGDVTLIIEWVPLDRHPIPINQRTLARHGSFIGDVVRGVLFVRLVSGEDLKNVDTIGLSDPYVILQIGGSHKVSKYINNNLNPVWNESFSWSGVRPSAVLHGEVKDKGTFKDLTLGVFKLPISSLLDPEGEVHPFTLPLKEKHGDDHAQGQINLQMCWKVWKKVDENTPQPKEPTWPSFADVGEATED